MTPQEIVTGSTCFDCSIPPGMQGAVSLYLLNEIRVLNGGDAMTISEIQEAAKCFHCINDQAAAQTYLLEQILAGQS